MYVHVFTPLDGERHYEGGVLPNLNAVKCNRIPSCVRCLLLHSSPKPMACETA